MGPPGKEKLTKIVDTFSGKNGIRILLARDKPRRELITAGADGLITVYNLVTKQPVYVF